MRHIGTILAAALVIALPFLFRQPPPRGAWQPGDPELVIISPHNEAIRYEFGRAFSDWHQQAYGTPVKVDWRAIGGTTEIMRYLNAEYVSAFRGWWIGAGRPWPADGGTMILDRKFDPNEKPDAEEKVPAWAEQRALHRAFRETDDAEAFTCKIDLFFGGGTYDHGKAFKQGMTLPPWGRAPTGTITDYNGQIMVPEKRSGETWRTPTFFGNALSTFGICYNPDRLQELGITTPPRQWADLADARYLGQLGVADPTKSGSIAKAFEMIIQEQCHRAVTEAGYTPSDVERLEAALRAGDAVPEAYAEAIDQGWLAGLRLVQLIGANARYFTDASGKVPVDVSTGNAAAGIAIDFYGRYQAEVSRSPEGDPRMVYITPAGGSSVSADPVSLLRGAPHRELAERFIEFVLRPEGQRLWNYAPGTPGGPHKYALRRLPVRRDFYPSDTAEIQTAYEQHARHTVDELGDPDVNPYRLSEQFVYRGRWTGPLFGFHRKFIKAMCMNAGEELRQAWQQIAAAGGPAAQPEAMRQLSKMPDVPERVSRRNARQIEKAYEELELMRIWTVYFRQSYRRAAELVQAPTKGKAEL